MRNGTLPAKIYHYLGFQPAKMARTADLVDGFGSPQDVSRALRSLVKEGRVETVGRGRYRVLPNTPPLLAFNRAWSNSGGALPANQLIAVTLARPTFRDVVRLCKAYGVKRVQNVLRDLVGQQDISAWQAAVLHRHLLNIEKGFRDAANRQLAG